MRNAAGRASVVTLLVGACTGGSTADVSPAFGTSTPVTAFVGVHVVPMDSERVLRDQTVIVRDGLIEAIGDRTEVGVPDEARVLEGRGRYLMPGLVDGHVHAWSEEHMRLYVANGITTVRNLWGGPVHLEWRERMARDPSFIAPTIYTAGPLIDGPDPIWRTSAVAETAEDGARLVGEHRAAGYDFIKVYNRLPSEAFGAIAEAAAQQGMPVQGHVPSAVGLYPALEAGMGGIEHFRGYVREVLADPWREALSDPGDWREARIRAGHALLDGSMTSQDFIDADRLARAVAATLEHGVWNTPTVTVVQQVAQDEFQQWRRSTPVRYLSDETIGGWDPNNRSLALSPDELRAIEAFHTHFSLHLIRALHRAGGRLVVGTDTPNPWVIPGFAIHDEIDFFQQAGLSPWETLERTTRLSAEYMGMDHDVGTVAPGMRADLLLLDGNPLEGTSVLRRPVGVMLRGRWIDRTELDRMLEDLEGDA